MLLKNNLKDIILNFKSFRLVINTNSKNYKLLEINRILLKYIINGLSATLFHYIILRLLLINFYFEYYATADFIAAFFGICFSYLGNKFFVFKHSSSNHFVQYFIFLIFYFLMMVIHSSIIFIISDIYNVNFNIGFVIATLFQFLFTYYVNKTIIFKLL